MPFSRSRSIESMTRSPTSWCSRNAPDCQSIASTSVVLPWSTCATIATLRMSSRVGTFTNGTRTIRRFGSDRGGNAWLTTGGEGRPRARLPGARRPAP